MTKTELFIGGRAHYHGPDTVTEICAECGATLLLQEANGHKVVKLLSCGGRFGNHLVEYDTEDTTVHQERSEGLG